ncbi:MAG: MFS transporter, partial [Gammaproteobacteria bacterium]
MESKNISVPGLKEAHGFLPYVLVVFINAFVDLGHKIIIQNTVFETYDGQEQIILTAIVNALILLPFIVLFSPAGFLSDKYPKNRIMIITAWGDVASTCLITLFYYLGMFWAAYTMTFIMGILAAVFSPAKYGYIKELVGKEKIAAANGVVQACTTIAILAGIFIYTFMFENALAGVDYSNKSGLLQV